MPFEPFIPLVPDAAGISIDIDGVTYRTLRRNAADELLIAGTVTVDTTGLATSARQDTMITALQLIDDLRNALAAVALDQLRTDVISSALPTGAATAARQDTMITALQLIDDLRNALVSVAGDKLRVDVIGELPAGAQNIGDVDLAGTSKTLTYTPIAAAASGDNTIFTATAGKTFSVVHFLLVAAAAVTAKLLSGADYLAGGASQGLALAANGGWAENTLTAAPIYKASGTGKAFIVNLSAAVAVAGHVVWFEE